MPRREVENVVPEHISKNTEIFDAFQGNTHVFVNAIKKKGDQFLQNLRFQVVDGHEEHFEDDTTVYLFYLRRLPTGDPSTSGWFSSRDYWFRKIEPGDAAESKADIGPANGETAVVAENKAEVETASEEAEGT